MLKNAIWYRNRGFIPLPLISGSKFPPKGFPLREVRWEMPTDDNLKAWFVAPSNLAIQPKGWQALDFDRADWIEVMEQEGIDDTYSYNTTRGGHVWVREWNGAKIDKVEVMGDLHERKYVVVPPSIVDGVKRTWRHPEKVKDLRVTNLPIVARVSRGRSLSLSKERENACSKERVRESMSTCLLEGVATPEHSGGRIDLREGARDESLYHLATCLKRGGMAKPDAIQVLKVVGESCSPPSPNLLLKRPLYTTLDYPQSVL